MKIDLREVPIYWATIEKNKERHGKMYRMFERLGFKEYHKLNGPIADPYTVGIAETHIRGLSNDLPLLMMEDDCMETEHFVPELEIPDDCDALYLGTSWFGMLRGVSTFRACISSDFSDVYVRPYNMLGVHAVLYLSEDYRDKAVNLLGSFKNNPGSFGCDECLAKDMVNNNILAVKKPFFYQNDGHSEEETLRPLNPYF